MESTTDRPLISLIRDQPAKVIAISAVSTIGGVIEAMLLVAVTRSGIAVTTGADSISLWRWEGSVESILVIGMVLAVVRFVLSYASAVLTAALVRTTAQNLRDELATAYLRASWPAQQANRVGLLQELLTTFVQEGIQLVTSFARALSAAFSLLALVIIAMLLDVRASAALLIALALLSAVLRPLRSRLRSQASTTSESGVGLATALAEVSQLGLETHVFDVRDAIDHKVRLLNEAHAEHVGSLTKLSQLLPAIYTFLAYLTLLGAVGMVIVLGSSDLTSLGAVLIVMLRSLSYGQTLQGASASMVSRLPFAERHRREVQHFQDDAVDSEGAALDEVRTIEVEHVSFAYEGHDEVLHDMSFQIENHEILGIVGPSGAGKSTLVELLLGLRSPTSGTVRADGRDINEFARHDWSRRVTFVPQQANLVAGTVADNIRFERDGVTHEMIVDAARRAQLHDEIERADGGYDRHLGPSGSQLSGGQRQRLIIARALVERPDVIILDEPTSALDARSEQLMRHTLVAQSESASVVVIAHRMSTLDICDRIMVVQDGRISAIGTPAELLETNEFYREALVLSGLH